MDKVRLPKDFKEFDGDEIMSNFDGVVNFKVAEAVKGEKLFSTYPGWNFYGYVWWEDKWYCEVWQYGGYSETFSAESLGDLKTEICDKYGYD